MTLMVSEPLGTYGDECLKLLMQGSRFYIASLEWFADFHTRFLASLRAMGAPALTWTDDLNHHPGKLTRTYTLKEVSKEIH